MSGKSLSYEYVRVAEHATCPEGRRHEYAGQRGLVLGLTGCRRRWRVQMADSTVIALPRTLLQRVKPVDGTAADAANADTMDARLAIATGRRLCNASMAAGYSDTWRLQSTRPGADDHERIPRREGSRRVYRDGRVEVVA